MTEAVLRSVLSPLVADLVYPDIAAQESSLPYITYQQVGGQSFSFLETAVVNKRNARFQINVWHSSRLLAANLSRSVEDALVSSTVLRAIPQGAMVAVYEPETGLYGARQDFSVWY